MAGKKAIVKPPPIPEASVSDGISLSLEMATASITGSGTLLPLCVERINTMELHRFPQSRLSRYTVEILRSATRSRIEVRGAPDTRGTFFTFVSYTIILFCLGTFTFPSVKKLFKMPTPAITVAQAQAVPSIPAQSLPVVDVSRLQTKKIARKTNRKILTTKTRNKFTKQNRWKTPARQGSLSVSRDMGGGFFNNTID